MSRQPTFLFVINGFFCAFCLLSMIVLGCGQFDGDKSKFAIIVGSSHITADEARKDIEFMAAGIDVAKRSLPGIRDQLIEQIIDHYLILEYGKEKGISVSEKELQDTINNLTEGYTQDGFKETLLKGYVDFEQWKRRLREQCLVKKIIEKVAESVVPPNYQEITRYFEDHEDEFIFPQSLKFRQVFTRTEEKAERVLKLLRQDEDMAELAKKYSIAPEAENGGEVGWVARGQLDESMERVLFSMKQGELSPVIQTPYGYHVFKVLSVRPACRRQLPEVISEIELRLNTKKQEMFVKNWIKDLRAYFKVSVNRKLL